MVVVGVQGAKEEAERRGAEAKGGPWGLEMDGNLLFFPRSLPLSLTLSSGSRLQQTGVVAGKAARSTQVGLSSTDAGQISVSASTP